MDAFVAFNVIIIFCVFTAFFLRRLFTSMPTQCTWLACRPPPGAPGITADRLVDNQAGRGSERRQCGAAMGRVVV